MEISSLATVHTLYSPIMEWFMHGTLCT